MYNILIDYDCPPWLMACITFKFKDLNKCIQKSNL